MGGFVIVYSMASILGIVFQCASVSDLWKLPSDDPLKCIRFNLFVLIMGVVNIATDIAILSLPIPLVWRLQVSKPRRWQLVLVFYLGGL